MGYYLSQAEFYLWFLMQQQKYRVFAPKRYSGGGRFSDTDCIRYGEIESAEEIVFSQKASYSYKEALLPVSQTLFYFTEDEIKEANQSKNDIVIFLRSCDLYGLKRLDDMYLQNGPADYYYSRLRNSIKIVLMGCKQSFDNCFCVSMGTNQTEQYDMAINVSEDGFYVDCKDEAWGLFFEGLGCEEITVTPDFVQENRVRVQIPPNLTVDVARASMWEVYNSCCIGCGRCNFVCPTCSCFTMQDLYYSENADAGERRRVWASCMVDGFTDVAGGGSYRKQYGERMRFKVLHKIYDHKKRYGHHMCVGCGRCDDICPEYISFSNCINRLDEAMKEVSENGEK